MGGGASSLSDIFTLATVGDTKGNIIKFFSEMAKGAKQAASSVGSSAGTIETALAGISGGLKGAWSSLSLFGKIGIVAAGISIVVGAVQKYKAHMEELRQAAEENSNAFSDSTKVIDDYSTRISELRGKLADGSLSETEAYQAKKELYDIQTQLNAAYGESASGLDLVNGKLDEQIKKLGDLAVLDAQRYLNENNSEIRDLKKRSLTEQMRAME